jgi:hypothetical protein
LVACRKPSISSVYAKGKKFHGIYSVVSGNVNAFCERWKADSLAYSLLSVEGMSDQSYRAILGHCEARLVIGETSYFAIPDRMFLQQLSAHFENLKIISSPRDFSAIVNETAGLQKAIYYPDSLLAPLRRANVTHLLTANLRLNPNLKSGQTINTVERVFTFIQEKYPAIFNRLVQIGAPDDEPAEIYQIIWNVETTRPTPLQ